MTAPVAGHPLDAAGFETWCREVEPRLRSALSATYGPEQGREATAEALAWAWEHRDQLAAISQPVAYLYRVGQSRSRRRKSRRAFERTEWREPWVEPALAGAVMALTERQRVAVVLIHGFEWSAAEVAALLECSPSTVETHLARALAHLRRTLEVTDNA